METTTKAFSLNDYFDKIYCIHLNGQKDRYDNIKKLEKDLNCDIEIFNAFHWRDLKLPPNMKINPGEYGCTYSHLKLWKHIVDNEIDNVLILEDDVILSQDLIKGVNFLFKIIPKDWDHIYLSGHIYFAWPIVLFPTVLPSSFKISGAYSYFLNKI
jgi:glycosyl transferase family 25